MKCFTSKLCYSLPEDLSLKIGTYPRVTAANQGGHTKDIPKIIVNNNNNIAFFPKQVGVG